LYFHHQSDFVMQISLIGLGKMGYPLALNMQRHHTVMAFDVQAALRKAIEAEGVRTAATLDALISHHAPRRVVWLMVPAGAIIDQILGELLPMLDRDDIVIDGGNSNYRDSQARAEKASAQGIHYLDCGTSGGTSGARHGVCAMIGGNKDAFNHIEPLIRDIALPGGYLYCGPSGSGHFTKMVHNGIEYGMMQSIAEGFAHLQASGMDLDLKAIAGLYNTGSVIRGWLMELTENALRKDPQLASIKGIAHASGEAQWMVEDAMARKMSIPTIALSLMARFQSQDPENFPAKVVAALRNEFGGHAVEKKG
jgi:6-phosphogluconate dehydrogenase